MLRDTAHIQEKDAEFVNKRLEKRKANGRAGKEESNGPVVPLYTMADAERTLPLFRGVRYHELFHLSDTLSYEAYDAGHILGSSCVMMYEESSGRAASPDLFRATWAGRICRSSAIPTGCRPPTT